MRWREGEALEGRRGVADRAGGASPAGARVTGARHAGAVARAARGRAHVALAGALAALAGALAAGCCALDLEVLAFEARARLEARPRFALLAPVLAGGDGWAFAAPVATARRLEGVYRPEGAPEGVAPVTSAPPALRACLDAAHEALLARGYRPADEDGAADLVVSLAVTRHGGGRLARVTVHAGGVLDGRFDPRLWGLSVVLPARGACEATADELVRALVDAFPDCDPAAARPR